VHKLDHHVVRKYTDLSNDVTRIPINNKFITKIYKTGTVGSVVTILTAVWSLYLPQFCLPRN